MHHMALKREAISLMHHMTLKRENNILNALKSTPDIVGYFLVMMHVNLLLSGRGEQHAHRGTRSIYIQLNAHYIYNIRPEFIFTDMG